MFFDKNSYVFLKKYICFFKTESENNFLRLRRNTFFQKICPKYLSIRKIFVSLQII